MEIGIQSYLLKDASKTEWVEALTKIGQGKTYFSKYLKASLPPVFEAFNEVDDFPQLATLSDQEKKIIRLTALGLTEQECDSGASLADLYSIGIHLGASQGITNTFVCQMIPADWQQNLRNHLGLVRSGIAAYSACIPGINPAVVNTVQVGSSNAYIPFSAIVGIHIQVL